MLELPDSLVDAAWLDAHLGDPDLRVYDCTVHLRPDPPRRYRVESGRADWAEGHVPGAGFLDLTLPPLSAPGRAAFLLPDPVALAGAFAEAGIGRTPDGRRTPVVLYATNAPMWATRVWWMLHGIGHHDAAVLDGGLAAWKAHGGELERGEPVPEPVAPEPPDPLPVWVDRHEVLAAVEAGGRPGGARGCILDALSEALHRGTAEIHYGRPGHIAHSRNLPYATLLDEQGRFRPPEAVAEAAAAVGIDREGPTFVYCGGGIAATCDAFALRRAGFRDLRVYDGSLTEWAADPALPMSTADDAP